VLEEVKFAAVCAWLSKNFVRNAGNRADFLSRGDRSARASENSAIRRAQPRARLKPANTDLFVERRDVIISGCTRLSSRETSAG